MHHSLKTPLAVLLTLVMTTTAKAAPSEVTAQTLTRTAANGLVLQTQLQKNIFRSEPYQAEYDVQVPYQDTETYWETVPYQDTETYTDTETYYQNEYRCQNYTDYERQCHNERQCGFAEKLDLAGNDKWGPGGGGPGGGGHGPGPGGPGGGGGHGPGPGGPGGGGGHGPGPGGPGGGGGHGPGPGPGGPGGGGGHNPPPQPPQCHDRQVCNNVPVTRQRCGYEQVAHTRPVTRTRTVTRYRQEQRTRTVTRYRTETRCCVTKYQDVFDHQWITQVSVQFPAGTELVNGEQETFKLELLGSESAPDVRLTPASTIFGYQIANKQVSGNQIVITLASVPRYKAGDVGPASLQNVTIAPIASGVAFSFADNALFPRTSSQYQVTVAEASTHEQVASSETIVAQQRQLSASLAFAWDPSKLYEVTINVHREGSVLDTGVVDFQIKKVISLTVDQAALKSDKNILNVGIVGAADQAVLSFTDLTLPYADVKTDYVITLVRNGASIGAKSFARTALVAAADASMAISLNDFGLKPAVLSTIKAGASLKVVIEVRRTQSGRSLIQFWKDSAIVVQ